MPFSFPLLITQLYNEAKVRGLRGGGDCCIHFELLCMVLFEIIGVRILTFLYIYIYLETANKNGNKLSFLFLNIKLCK